MTHSDPVWFALAIAKEALLTGFGPALILYFAARKFTSWGERTASKSLQGQAMYLEAGARPSVLKEAA